MVISSTPEGVTHYNGAPTVQMMVINHARAHRLERPVTVMVAATPPSPTLFGRLSELNFRVIHVYGLTETYGPITGVSFEQGDGWRGPSRWRATPNSWRGKGRPTRPPIWVRIVDEDMQDVPQDGEGYGRSGHAGQQRDERILP